MYLAMGGEGGFLKKRKKRNKKHNIWPEFQGQLRTTRPTSKKGKGFINVERPVGELNQQLRMASQLTSPKSSTSLFLTGYLGSWPVANLRPIHGCAALKP
jgi:hypothetical protein